MSNYYVYLYWRLDTNEIFYVGKGHDDRWKTLRKRNDHFNNIINKCPIAVEIIKDNLTEEQAFYWEEEIIETLVFKYGYSIDIKNNRSNKKPPHLANQTWGGEGTSGRTMSKESKEKMSKDRMGEGNSFYNKHHTEESKGKISRANKGKMIGELNPMYGKSGINNPSSRSVICLTTKRIFFTTKDGGKCYGIDRRGISACCRGKRKSAGKINGIPLKWKYLNWNHNKKYRVKGGETMNE